MSRRSAAAREAWVHDAALDAVVAAPGHHRLLLENDRVRVLHTRVGPGEKVPLHTHRWPAVYHVKSWSDFVRRNAAGEVMVDTRTASGVADMPPVVWLAPLEPHTLENVGDRDIDLVSIEVKEPEDGFDA
ncbi:MAG: hypothetical protein ACM3JJ_10755 [Hyphomicrobiales bacterium]